MDRKQDKLMMQEVNENGKRLKEQMVHYDDEKDAFITFDGLEVPFIFIDKKKFRKLIFNEKEREWLNNWAGKLLLGELAEILAVSVKTIRFMRQRLGIEHDKLRPTKFISYCNNPQFTNEEWEQSKKVAEAKAEAKRQERIRKAQLREAELQAAKEAYRQKTKEQQLQAKKEHQEQIELRKAMKNALQPRTTFQEPKSKCIPNCWVKMMYPKHCTKRTCYHDLSEWKTNGISHPEKKVDR